MIYVCLADGFEEIEAITVTDILRRAGAEVKMVSITDRLEVKGAHGIKIQADILFEEADDESCRMIVLPGGMPGTTNLLKHEGLVQKIRQIYERGEWVCAICAAPMVLAAAGVLAGKKATIYPGMEKDIEGAIPTEGAVVRDGNVITSKAPGTAMKFALALVEALYGKEKAERLEKDELRS